MPVQAMIPIKPLDRGGPEEARKSAKREEGASRSDPPDFMALLFQVLDPQRPVIQPAGGGAMEKAEAAEPEARVAPWTPGGFAKQENTPDAALPRALPAASVVRVPAAMEEKPNDAPPVLPAEQTSAEDLGSLHPGMGKASAEVPVPFHPPGGETGNSGRPPFPEPGNPSLSLETPVPAAAPSGSPEERMGVSGTPVTDRPTVHIDPRNLMEQVGGRIVPVIRNGGGAGEHVVKIQLQPESLGRLEVRISVSDNQVATAIVTESETARDLIQSHQHLLRAALVEQGFSVADLRVDVGHQPPGWEHPTSSDSPGNGAQREGSGPEDDSGGEGWRDPPPGRKFAGMDADRLVSIFA